MADQADDLCECIQCGRMHRHLGSPPWALSHDDLCRLSRLFGFAGDIRTSQDQRINEWLKKLIEDEVRRFGQEERPDWSQIQRS